MSDLRYTLTSDGSSDRALLPVLNWLLRANGFGGAVQSYWADFRWLPRPPTSLADRVEQAVRLYPCDALFVHRDAEALPAGLRAEEIRDAAVAASRRVTSMPPYVCVVPVRMQEAWLLFDEAALRRAAGNPNGAASLALPRIAELEHVTDPKALLHDLLRQASGLGARRQRRMVPESVAWRIPEYVSDFSPLRTLSAFATLERDVAALVASLG